MSNPYDESPLNPLPMVVILLAGTIFAIEMIFQLGERGLIGGPTAVGWRLSAMTDYAFSGDVLDQMIARNLWPTEHLIRFVTYPFINGSFSQAIFVIVFILALGKMVGEIFSGVAVLVIFFGSAIMGALVYGLALNDPYPLVGGFPAAYGLIGAYSFVHWVRLKITGEPVSQAFTLIAFLMGIQLIFGLLFGGSNDWVADLTGFVTGFALSFVVRPGGWAHLMGLLRQR